MKVNPLAFTALCLGLAGTAVANGPASSILSCRSIADDTSRLACFDRESAAMASSTNTAPAATRNTPPDIAPPAVASREPESAGNGNTPGATQTPAQPAPIAAKATASPPATTSSSATGLSATTTPSTTTGLSAATTSSATLSPSAATGVSAATAPSAAPPLDPKTTFGLPAQVIQDREVAAGLRPKDLSTLTAHIDHVSSAAGGRMVFALDNHQVWQQLLAEGDFLTKPGEEVKITRGLLGSYYLEAASSGRGCKVTRLR